MNYKFFTILLFFFATTNLYSQVVENNNLGRVTTEIEPLKFGFISYLQVGLVYNDFDAFKPVLREWNIDVMNEVKGVLVFGMTGTYKRWLAGLDFGFSNNEDYNHDSLNITFNTTQYGIHFGYNLINSKRFLITSKASVQWHRYRLINSKKDDVSLAQYLPERDLDVRFNQLTGFLGLNLSYKFCRYNILPCSYWTAGLYGGYIFKLNKKPWVYSPDKRLLNENEIDMKNFTFGVYFSYNFE